MEREGLKKKTARIATGVALGLSSLYMGSAITREIINDEAQKSEIIGSAEVIAGTALGSLYALNEPFRKRTKQIIGAPLFKNEGNALATSETPLHELKEGSPQTIEEPQRRAI